MVYFEHILYHLHIWVSNTFVYESLLSKRRKKQPCSTMIRDHQLSIFALKDIMLNRDSWQPTWFRTPWFNQFVPVIDVSSIPTSTALIITRHLVVAFQFTLRIILKRGSPTLTVSDSIKCNGTTFWAVGTIHLFHIEVNQIRNKIIG